MKYPTPWTCEVSGTGKSSVIRDAKNRWVLMIGQADLAEFIVAAVNVFEGIPDRTQNEGKS